MLATLEANVQVEDVKQEESTRRVRLKGRCSSCAGLFRCVSTTTTSSGNNILYLVCVVFFVSRVFLIKALAWSCQLYFRDTELE